ncbi:hypothetical protein WG907_07640 [Sphingobium sp. AN558]|uniref:hypothetical protein n=1 Tax=Sphingobium sp. AN558 TaxID=3133442 RepID=UPI0030C4DDB1
MFLTLASGIALATLSNPVHNARIDHASTAYTAAYQTQSTLHLEQVNAVHPMREAQPRCRWKADLVVHRAVQGQGASLAALSKPIHNFAPLAGTYAGGCASARPQIEAAIARHSQARAAEAAAIAQQDRTVLVGELDGIHALTVKGG